MGMGGVAVVLAVFVDLAGRFDAALIFGIDDIDKLRKPPHSYLVWLGLSSGAAHAPHSGGLYSNSGRCATPPVLQFLKAQESTARMLAVRRPFCYTIGTFYTTS
jgi:hypothetical protein